MVFLDTEKTFDTKWHSGLLYKLSKFEFRPTWSSFLALFFHKENTEFR
jgi:hypothetical protein